MYKYRYFGLLILFVAYLQAGTFSFEKKFEDTSYGNGTNGPGWIQAGDMDNDGDVDIVAGGGNRLHVYENNGSESFTESQNLDASTSCGANGGVLYDVDGDTYLDIVSAKYYNDVGWWKNPSGNFATTWTFYIIYDTTWYLHDLKILDIDDDGTADEFVANLNSEYWGASIKIMWFDIPGTPTDPWTSHVIESNRAEGADHNHAGFDTADVDDDGNVDVVYSDGWYEAPDDPAGSWTFRDMTNIYGISNTVAKDFNNDGYVDICKSAGHHGQGVFLFTSDGTPIDGGWTMSIIGDTLSGTTSRHYYTHADEADRHFHHPEGLAFADLDSDGDLDCFAVVLYFGEDTGEPDWCDQADSVMIYENTGSVSSPIWTYQSNATLSGIYPMQSIFFYDVDGDGNLDLLGMGSGCPSITYYENLADPVQQASSGMLSGGDGKCKGGGNGKVY